MHELRFVSTHDKEKTEFPFETPGTVKFRKVVAEVGKKLQHNVENIMISPPGGSTLTASEYNLPVNEIVDRYGTRYQIVPKGVVG